MLPATYEPAVRIKVGDPKRAPVTWRRDVSLPEVVQARLEVRTLLPRDADAVADDPEVLSTLA